MLYFIAEKEKVKYTYFLMKKQTIYSYLQRSLVKVLTKSINSNKSSLAKPLNTMYAGLASYARSAKKLKKLESIVFLLAKHKHNKTLGFFRKGNTKKGLRFTCQFYLISFIKPKPAMLLSNADAMLYLTLHSKLKLLKLNIGFFNNKLFFFLPFGGTHFFRKAHSRNFRVVQAKLCLNLLVTPFFVPLNFFHFNYFYRIKALVGRSLDHVASNFGQPQKDSKAFFCFAGFLDQRAASFARFRFFNCNSSNAQLFNQVKKKWYLFQNKKEKEKKTNFYFYIKNPQLNSCLWPFSFRAHKRYHVHQSFYKRKRKSINYIKTFHKLSAFLSLLCIGTNKNINMFYYASLLRQALQTQQVLYHSKIYTVPSSFPVLFLSKTNINYKFPLYSLRNQIIETKKENQSIFFNVLPLLTLIFYGAIKYIKKKKEKNFAKEPTLNVLIYQSHEISEQNFLSFRPFCGKVVEIGKTLKAPNFFLMRPLFSLTRLDTFFICESLKLPIYPDKSNLRVDFLRNRVRKQILPAIRILLNPQFDTILCKFNESAG